MHTGMRLHMQVCIQDRGGCVGEGTQRHTLYKLFVMV
jgi:hypothetical protein